MKGGGSISIRMTVVRRSIGRGSMFKHEFIGRTLIPPGASPGVIRVIRIIPGQPSAGSASRLSPATMVIRGMVCRGSFSGDHAIGSYRQR